VSQAEGIQPAHAPCSFGTIFAKALISAGGIAGVRNAVVCKHVHSNYPLLRTNIYTKYSVFLSYGFVLAARATCCVLGSGRSCNGNCSPDLGRSRGETLAPRRTSDFAELSHTHQPEVYSTSLKQISTPSKLSYFFLPRDNYNVSVAHLLPRTT
jgi:hypothetical protein